MVQVHWKHGQWAHHQREAEPMKEEQRPSAQEGPHSAPHTTAATASSGPACCVCVRDCYIAKTLNVFLTGCVIAILGILFWPWRRCCVLVTCQPRIKVWRTKRPHKRSTRFELPLHHKCGDSPAQAEKTNAHPDTDSSTSWSDGVPIEL